MANTEKTAHQFATTDGYAATRGEVTELRRKLEAARDGLRRISLGAEGPWVAIAAEALRGSE